MRLLITTLGRPDRQTTLVSLPRAVLPHTHLVVQHHEWGEYERLWGSACAGVLPLPSEIVNLGATRQYIAEQCSDEKIVLLDDDLSFYVRPRRGDWHLRQPTEAQLLEMFQEIEFKLDDYAHVGVSGREGNNREEKYGVECSRYMRLLAYNYKLWPDGIQCDRVNGMSDFDTALQLLRAGRPSYVFFRYAQGQPATQTPGGCALNRTIETHTAEVERMLQLHPGLVSRREKKNKGGGDFGTRPELTIEWKRALDHG